MVKVSSQVLALLAGSHSYHVHTIERKLLHSVIVSNRK